MRNSEKNKSTIYYALRNVQLEKDEWGNTKDVTTYGKPHALKLSVSANRGETSASAFGADLKYDREMITHDMTCPIDEYTRLWIDEPSIIDETIKTVWSEGGTIYINESGSVIKAEESGFSVLGVKAHNYEVAAVSKSLNCIRYAIRRVNVSE